MKRRSFLASGLAGLAAAAGCASESTELASHDAATALDAQPVLGPEPGTAEGTIIAFEDPSCPSCRRFEAVVLPKLKRGLVDPGRVSFVYRNIHVVRAWAEYATLALETVYARDPAAFWRLKSYYFQNKPVITTQNVESHTRQFLESSPLDAASVRQVIESGAHRPALRTDVEAAEAAGVHGTPTFFLFDGAPTSDSSSARSSTACSRNYWGSTMASTALDLPTRRDDCRTLLGVTAGVLRRPLYASLAVTYAVVALTTFVLARNVPLVRKVLVGVLSLAGASGLLTVLPLPGLEISILAAGTLVLSTYWLATAIRHEDRRCDVPADA